MRDSKVWKSIASYYIESLFFNELLKPEFKKMVDPASKFSETEIFMRVNLLSFKLPREITFCSEFLFFLLVFRCSRDSKNLVKQEKSATTGSRVTICWQEYRRPDASKWPRR